jgi:hypothetical protein
MGIYSDYLNQQMSFSMLTNERKKQLKRISSIRGRGVIVFASDVAKDCPNSIDYSDIVPFSDQLSTLSGEEVDIILETPGGFAEVVEDLVKLIRSRFNKVGIIVPGTAKSAGTIFTMAADEILMGPTSSLGPIDAQMVSNGKRFSADAFLAGFNAIRKEAEERKHLDIAYIPILQNISPGEIQHCENAQAFSRTLVTNWLKDYKFKFWETHSSTGKPVSDEEKKNRANTIATLLCNHGHWLTHGRSIKLSDLEEMRLQITNYSNNLELDDAITRYYTLLRMSFETNIYKIYETTESQIYRSINTASPPPQNQPPALPNPLLIDFNCRKCHSISKIQINFEREFPIQEGALPFPKDNLFKCPACSAESNLLSLRQQLEAQTHKIIV